MHPRPGLADSGTAQCRDVHRLFFALWPDRALRQRIESATLGLVAGHGTRGRRTAPDRYHLTLQFLGDFEEPAQSVTDDAIAAADSVRARPFELSLSRAGNFGGTRVGWLGPASMPAGLQRLRDALELALCARGIAPIAATTFTPHVTVLRNMRQPLPASSILPLSWPVHSFVLIDSHPGRGTYTELRRWTLQPEAINPGEVR